MGLYVGLGFTFFAALQFAPHSLPVTSRLLLLVVTLLFCPVQAHLSKRSYSDQSVHGYMTEVPQRITGGT